MSLSPRQVCMSLTLTVLGPFMTTNLWTAGAAEPVAVIEQGNVDTNLKSYSKVSGVSERSTVSGPTP